jgi:hypothetical protein
MRGCGGIRSKKYGIIVIHPHLNGCLCVVKAGSIIAEGCSQEVFYDDALLAEAGLKKPRIAAIYEALCAQIGAPVVQRPITIEQLIQWAGHMAAPGHGK